jgi:hypothetical protein
MAAPMSPWRMQAMFAELISGASSRSGDAYSLATAHCRSVTEQAAGTLVTFHSGLVVEAQSKCSGDYGACSSVARSDAMLVVTGFLSLPHVDSSAPLPASARAEVGSGDSRGFAKISRQSSLLPRGYSS